LPVSKVILQIRGVPPDLHSEKLPITHSICQTTRCNKTLPRPFKLHECL
jgi:hypothetical protein